MMVFVSHLILLCMVNGNSRRPLSDMYEEMPWKRKSEIAPNAKRIKDEDKEKMERIAITCALMDELHQSLKDLNAANFADELKDINDLVNGLLSVQNDIYEANAAETVKIIRTLKNENKLSYEMRLDLFTTLRLFGPDPAYVLVLETLWASEQGGDEFKEIMQFVLDQKIRRESFKEAMESDLLSAHINDEFNQTVNTLFDYATLNQMVQELDDIDKTFEQKIGDVEDLAQYLFQTDGDVYQDNMCNLIEIMHNLRIENKLSEEYRADLMKILGIEPLEMFVLEGMWDFKEFGLDELKKKLKWYNETGIIDGFIEIMKSKKFNTYVKDKEALRRFDLITMWIVDSWENGADPV